MPITSRKTRSLFSSETLSFAANHKAKSDRSPRPRRSRAGRSFSSPQPSQDRTARQETDGRQHAANWPAKPLHGRQIKLPAVPIDGDPASIDWRTFREAYAKLAEAAFSIHTVRDWRAAESILDEEFSPKFARDLTAEMLADFEQFVAKVGYSRHRVNNMASRLHHMILWGCECGYLDREAFGIGHDLRWPIRDKGGWAKRREAAA